MKPPTSLNIFPYCRRMEGIIAAHTDSCSSCRRRMWLSTAIWCVALWRLLFG